MMEPAITPEENAAAEDMTLPLRTLLSALPEYLRNKGEARAALLVTHVLRRQIQVELNLRHGRKAFDGLVDGLNL